MKHHFSVLVVAAVVLTIGTFVARAETAQEPHHQPNIILIFADDLGINDLGCYGRKDHHTPNLDRLATQGMRFTCAYAAQPICSPSRAALMTGKCPARLHLTNYLPGRPDARSQRLLQPRMEGQLPLEEVTLAELLKNAGYATGIFGKWHLGGAGFGPMEQGFDINVSPPANTLPTRKNGGKGEFAITDAAEQFIVEHHKVPFFCYVPHNNPHVPLAAAPELIEKHRDAFNPIYAAMIETLDESVGRLIAKVDSLGLTNRTIIIFTSDNGGLHVLESPHTPATHNRPFRAGKGYVYEGGLRVPLLVRWPSVVPAGGACTTPVVLTDLVPTLLEAAGVDPAEAVGPLDGNSMAKLLGGEPQPAPTLYWHFPHYTNQGGRPAGAIRKGDWKLIEHFEDGSVELFNLDKDESESNNLSASEPARVANLQQRLAAWRKSVGAQIPISNSDFDVNLHRRLYLEQDPSLLLAEPTAAATEPQWAAWRKAMSIAVAKRKPSVTSATGDIRLHAKDARVHAQAMRYEPEPNKNVLGYWTNIGDWADWDFKVDNAGTFEVEVQQGCGQGSGGAEVAVEIAEQSLIFTVEDTGHFQHMIQRIIGRVELSAGKHTLAVKPQSKPGAAVMDLRRVVLRPVEDSNPIGP